MKKNITINLCGRLFAIDEDAYEMLSTYEQSLRNYFRTREGGEEITNDIEARIAELLDEVKQGGSEAITIDHVREIIHRIGKPEEMEEEMATHSAPEGAAAPSSPSSNTSEAPSGAVGGGTANKRLFRNPADKKMMGVLAGLAAYFGGDVLWWRLAYAGLVLLSFTGSSYNFLWFLPHQSLYFNLHFWGFSLIIAYVLLAILMPVAETPEDRLMMQGKEVNPQNLAEEIAKSPSPVLSPVREENRVTSSNHQSSLSTAFGCIGGFFVALWTVIATLFRWCIYAWGAFVAVMCLVGIVCLTAFAVNPYELLQKGDPFFLSSEFTALVPELSVPFYIFVVAIGLVLAITAYAIIHSLLNEFKQMPAMPYRQRIALLLIWIACLVVAGASIGYGFPKIIKASDQYHSRFYSEWVDNNR